MRFESGWPLSGGQDSGGGIENHRLLVRMPFSSPEDRCDPSPYAASSLSSLPPHPTELSLGPRIRSTCGNGGCGSTASIRDLRG